MKDESNRLGLPASKILGASYAISRAISARLDQPFMAYTLEELRTRLAGSPLSLVADTDGNHGRAVAHVAQLLGIPARVYIPAEVSNGRRFAAAEDSGVVAALAEELHAVTGREPSRRGSGSGQTARCWGGGQ